MLVYYNGIEKVYRKNVEYNVLWNTEKYCKYYIFVIIIPVFTERNIIFLQ